MHALKWLSVCLAVLFGGATAWAGVSPDLVVSAAVNSPGAAFAGGVLEVDVTITNQGAANTLYSPGDVVLRADLSALADYPSVTSTTSASSADLSCSIDANVLACEIVGNNFSRVASIHFAWPEPIAALGTGRCLRPAASARSIPTISLARRTSPTTTAVLIGRW